MAATWEIASPPILTMSASDLSRDPLQTGQVAAVRYLLRNTRTGSL